MRSRRPGGDGAANPRVTSRQSPSSVQRLVTFPVLSGGRWLPGRSLPEPRRAFVYGVSMSLHVATLYRPTADC